MSAGPAHAQTIGSCAAGTDSPLGVATICDNVCQVLAGGSAVVCDFSTCAGPVEWTIGSNYANGYEEVAYGDCNGTPRCCVLQDNGGQVTEFWTVGSAYSDTLSHWYLTANGAGSRTSYILGGDGGDLIAGSDDASVAEHLYGESHPDNMKGSSGADHLYGGQGNDVMHGNSENDCMWGGLGYDEIYSGSGNDTLVDECQGNGTDHNYMDGGAGDDALWYEWDAGTCGGTSVLDGASGCGAGSDDFGEVAGSQTKPGDCQTTIFADPSATRCPDSLGETPPTPPQD